jgi:tetratricopeptide (TPR) repeat protein
MFERGHGNASVSRRPSHLAAGQLLVGLAALWASVAQAAPDKMDDKSKAAQVECAAGDFQTGVRLLAESWGETRNPTYIYYQGRCYEQNGQSARAAERFREYLRIDKGAWPDEVKDLEARIAALETGGSRPGNGAGLKGALANSEANLTNTMAPRQLEPTPSIYQRWWFWTGVGAVVAGAVMTLLIVNRDSNPCGGASRTCVEVN